MSIGEHIAATTDFLRDNDVRETTVLNSNLNVLVQDLFDAARCHDFQKEPLAAEPVMQAIFLIYKLDHWVRKLTAGTLIRHLLVTHADVFRQFGPALLENGAGNLRHKKREVRDATAQFLAELDENSFAQLLARLPLSEGDGHEYREAVSMLCGYRLARGYDGQCMALLGRNAEYNAGQDISTNYVRWYTEKAIAKAISCRGADTARFTAQTVYPLIRRSFGVSEMKVRKSAAEAAGVFFALSEDNLGVLEAELRQIKERHMAGQNVDYAVHTVLLAASTFIQIVSGTHVSYRFSNYALTQDSATTLARLLKDIYTGINDEFSDVKTLNGMYRSAMLVALVPEPSVIKQELNRVGIMNLDGAINASIYMQRYFREDIANYRLELLLLTQYNSKAIAVLALRALHFRELFFEGKEVDVNGCDFSGVSLEELVDFCVEKITSQSVDIRQCSCKLVSCYIKESGCELDEVHIERLIEVVQDMFMSQQFKAQKNNQLALKAGADLLCQMSPQLNKNQIKQITHATQEFFLERDDCCSHLGQFYVMTGNKRYAQYCLIYAFDAVNFELAEHCKTFLGLAADLFDEAELCSVVREDFLCEGGDNLILNGVSRLLFSLRVYKGVELSEASRQLMEDIINQADEFFDEVIDVFRGYQDNVFKAPGEDVEGDYQLPLDPKLGFDTHAAETASYLLNNVREQRETMNIQDVLLGRNREATKFIENLFIETVVDTSVQEELKELLAGCLIGVRHVFAHAQPIDIKKNEVFDFNAING